ncbi:OPA3-like protein [Lachancea thermotolerans]|uniref:KLTH0C10626p n=1 Tax=Lachancea thermotolerans (strain ATCC 56472 / CBS 6340 / NRRL Y-8284) TaxID=559295 RepID=C5DEN2_LACTC|nr:KLTH0C10626p [Lachancea thermotolerans CBS 6340]CAR22243.1 KLTH0C10626p [Lachancea thermotolerans CBS 6340]
MSGLALKLGTLLIRQVTRPVANVLKAQAKQHDTFKKVCVGLAQKMHRVDARLRTRMTPGNREIKIRPLNDARAVENGATWLSEAFVFGVTGSVVVWETLRQRTKELNRREQVANDISFLQSEIESLREKLDAKERAAGK